MNLPNPSATRNGPDGTFIPAAINIQPGGSYSFAANPVIFIPDDPAQTNIVIEYTVSKSGNELICSKAFSADLDELQGKLPGGKAKNAGSPDKNGVKPDKSRVSLSVVPNPVASAALVRYSVENPVAFTGGMIKLYSLEGRLIESKRVNTVQGQTKFDMNALASGTYVLVFFDKNRRVGQQVLIKD